jgi:hypothetical protein
MSITVDWPGKSGRTYRYFALENPTKDGIQAVAGNYVIAKQLPNGNFVPLYFGQADNLQARIPTHERMPEAIVLGATHVMAHSTLGGEYVRCDEECDLIEQWHPPMNVQHRQVS